MEFRETRRTCNSSYIKHGIGIHYLVRKIAALALAWVEEDGAILSVPNLQLFPSLFFMFGQDLSRKKIYPTAMKVNHPGTEIVRSDLFICLETVSLSLVSAQEGCLTLLRCLPLLRSGRQLLRSVRQLPSFSTTVESETISRQIKSVLTSVLSLGFTFLGSRNIHFGGTPRIFFHWLFRDSFSKKELDCF